MNQQKNYMGLCAAVLVGGALCCGVSVRAEMAQGDGDPYEVIPQELPVGSNIAVDKTAGLEGQALPKESLYIDDKVKAESLAISEESAELRSDEQGETADNAIATVTADGDFLLPTYLLPGETATVTRKTVVEQVVEEPSVQVVQEKTTTTQGGARVVADTEPQEVDILKEIQKAQAIADVKEEQKAIVVEKPKVIAREETRPVKQYQKTYQAKQIGTGHRLLAQQRVSPRRKLLLPLAPVAEQNEAEPILTPHVRAVAPSVYADQILDSYERGTPLAFLMPRDLKISFYPRESSFSGQSLKWVKAFAVAALNDPRLVVEIRVSRMDPELQSKRLFLIENALKGAGLSTHQMRVAYTDRTVDTMLLRAVPRPESRVIVTNQGETKLPKNVSKVTKW